MALQIDQSSISYKTRLYVSLDPRNKADVSSSLDNLEHRISDIQLWMTKNIVKLNKKKARFTNW